MASNFLNKLAISLLLLTGTATIAAASPRGSRFEAINDVPPRRGALEDPQDRLLVVNDDAGPMRSSDPEETRVPTWRFNYGGQKVRGVNLGGWLVLEPWITPSLFDQTGNDAIVDEYTFCQYQAYHVAHEKLEQHWETWITEEDIWQIKEAGLNHLRIPIGYWAYDTSAGEPYHQGADVYLRRAIEWAGKAGLSVWIDLHGAPGSQNGFDNSGQRMARPTWHTQPGNVARTNAIIKKLATEYSQDKYPQVAGIAPLNEPAGFWGQDIQAVTRQYWYDSYGNIRYPYGTPQESNLLEVIHDAFQPLSYWRGFARSPGFQGVALDTHIYEVFSNGEVARNWEQHIGNICRRGNEIASFAYGDGGLWTVVGEWSLAAYDCAKYLNGRGVGARYDGTIPNSPRIGSCEPFTGDGSHFSSHYKTFLRKFWEAQVTSFEKGQGWVFWTWKAENADEWDYSAGLRHGWIPRNPDERLYPNICG